MTPQASFATDPLSFNFDQKPPLQTKKKSASNDRTQRTRGTHKPKNRLLFRYPLALVTYTVPIVCKISTPKLSTFRSSASRFIRSSHAAVSGSPCAPGFFALTNGRSRSMSLSVSIRTRASNARFRSRSCAASFSRCSGVSFVRFFECGDVGAEALVVAGALALAGEEGGGAP